MGLYCLRKVAVPFYILTAMNQDSCCSASLPAVVVISILDFGHPNGCVLEVFNLCTGSVKDISDLVSAHK